MVNTVKDILKDIPIYNLPGNKKDIIMEEKIDKNKGKEKAEQKGSKFKLTSAITGYYIKIGGSIMNSKDNFWKVKKKEKSKSPFLISKIVHFFCKIQWK